MDIAMLDSSIIFLFTIVGQEIADHFPDVRKMVILGSGAEREVDDILQRVLLMNVSINQAELTSRHVLKGNYC